MSDYWSYYDDSLPEPPPAKVWVNNQEYRRVDDAASPAAEPTVIEDVIFSMNSMIGVLKAQGEDWDFEFEEKLMEQLREIIKALSRESYVPCWGIHVYPTDLVHVSVSWGSRESVEYAKRVEYADSDRIVRCYVERSE